MTENKLISGDYVPDECGGVMVLEGAEALLQRALFCMQTRRGSFPFLPELGSRLYLLGKEKPSALKSTATAYIQEALEELPLTVREVTVTRGAENMLAVTVLLQVGGETAELEVTV